MPNRALAESLLLEAVLRNALCIRNSFTRLVLFGALCIAVLFALLLCNHSKDEHLVLQKLASSMISRQIPTQKAQLPVLPAKAHQLNQLARGWQSAKPSATAKCWLLNAAAAAQSEPTSFASAVSPQATSYDLAVVGAGPVGVAAALRAAEQGKKVALIDAPSVSAALMVDEEDLSFGAPSGLFSKALRDTAKRLSISTLRDMGLDDKTIWQQVLISCAELARANARAKQLDIASAGITYMCAKAKLCNGGKSICVTGNGGKQNSTVLTPHNILLAAGSRPFRPKNIPFDGKRIFDSDSINTLSFLPRSIAITGSGIIAIEFAKIFANLGAAVTLIVRDKFPTRGLEKVGLDKDIAAALMNNLRRSNIRIERGAQASTFCIEERPKPITIGLTSPDGSPRPAGQASLIKVDAYLAAVGRVPNTDDLELVDAGIDFDEYGNIVVGPDLRTTSKANIYAAGDIVGRPFLASTGAAQAVAAISAMFEPGKDRGTSLGATGASFDPTSLAGNKFAFPVGVWSNPEIAYYGLNKRQAEAVGHEACEGLALYKQSLRGVCFQPEGLLKLVFENQTGRILGVHILGCDACELIHYGMELVRTRRTIDDVLEEVYTAVTFHELYQIAARAGADPKCARARRIAAGKSWRERERLLNTQPGYS